MSAIFHFDSTGLVIINFPQSKFIIAHIWNFSECGHFRTSESTKVKIRE